MGAGDPRWLAWIERVVQRIQEWLDRRRRRP